MPTMKVKFNYKGFTDNLQSNYREKVQKELPKIIAQEAKDFFTDNFAKEGWEDKGFQRWQEPQRRLKGSRARKKNEKKGRKIENEPPILVQSGRLKNSLQDDETIKADSSLDSIKLGITGDSLITEDNPEGKNYAYYLSEEGVGNAKIKRPILYKSEKLIEKIKDFITDYFKKEWFKK